MSSKHFPIVVLILIMVLIVGQRIIYPFTNSLSWDVLGYYLYLPATFIHHDFGLKDRAWIDLIIQKYQNTDFFYQAYPGINHCWKIKYAMGLSIFYAPFFFIAHIVAGWFGYARDGFSLPYQFTLSFGMLLYTFTGLYFLKKIISRFFDGYFTGLILLFVVFGTNFFHLTADNGLMPHNIVFMLVAMFIWFSIRWTEEPKIRYAIYLGIISALIALSRLNEIICFLFLVVWMVFVFKSVKKKLFHVFYAIPAFVICMIPQMIYWKITTGDLIGFTYQDTCEGFDFNEPNTLSFLFSFRKGWFVYTPLVMFMLSGMIVLYHKNKRLFYSIAAYVVVSAYIISAWSAWTYGGCCYSQRAVMSLYVVLALPFGYLLQWIFGLKWYFKYTGITILILTVFLNLFQMWQFNHGIIPLDLSTKEYYFSTFGKTKMKPEYLSLLLPEPRINEDTVKKDFIHLPFTTYGMEYIKSSGEFKPEKLINKSTLSADPFYQIDTNVEFSPSINIGYKTIKLYSWAMVNVDLYFPAQSLKQAPFLVTTTLHNSENCKYYTFRLPKDSVHFNTWIHINRLYLTPEPRSHRDILSVYLWNPDKALFYIRNLKVDMYDFK